MVTNNYSQEPFSRDFTWCSPVDAAEEIFATIMNKETRKLPTEITVDIALDEISAPVLKKKLIEILEWEKRKLRAKNIHRLLLVHNSKIILDYTLLN
jgi:hypothetical protein